MPTKQDDQDVNDLYLPPGYIRDPDTGNITRPITSMNERQLERLIKRSVASVIIPLFLGFCLVYGLITAFL